MPPLPNVASALPTIEDYLAGCAATPDAIAESIRTYHRWRFDNELGVVEGDYVGEFEQLPGGIDGTANVGTIEGNGARCAFMYADQEHESILMATASPTATR
jgi:hypothetical protein